MPAAPPDVGASAFVLHKADENTDSCLAVFPPAPTALLPFAQRLERNENFPAGAQSPRPIYPAREQVFPAIRDPAP